MEKIYALKIFEWVDSHTIQMIVNNCPKEYYKANEVILTQGDENNGKWYILTQGKVDIIIHWEYRTTLDEWNIFWEIALLNEEQRTATVQAKTDVECLIISQDTIFELINNGNYSINWDIINRIEENLKHNS